MAGDTSAPIEGGGHRCEFRPEIGWAHDPIYGDRCEARTGLDVHHKTYDRVGYETDDDLEVLCRLHHLVRHAMETADCELCGDTMNVEEDVIITMVEDAIAAAGDGEKVSLDDLDIPTICDHCEHVFGKDD
jgi:hypothetical protein